MLYHDPAMAVTGREFGWLLLSAPEPLSNAAFANFSQLYLFGSEK